MNKISAKPFTQNKNTISIFERVRDSKEANSLMLFAHKDEESGKLGYLVDDLDFFVGEISFAGRWGLSYRGHCVRRLDSEMIPLINMLKINEIYYSHYVNINSPLSFLLVRGSARYAYILIHDAITNTICYGSIDTDECEMHTSVYYDDISRLVPESEALLYMNAFTKDYGLQS